MKQKSYDHGIQVRRRWFDRDGAEIDPDWCVSKRLQVGDLVRVEVSLRRLVEGGDIANIALVDALPACMEVENPRLSGSAVSRGVRADRVEFLDDRVVLFASARRRATTFSYSLRVSSAGSFAWPPMQASSMYDGSIASLQKGPQDRLQVER